MKIITSLKKPSEFLHIRQQGKKLVTKSFIVQACPSIGERMVIPRFGFIVTKKNGNAVYRNRIKRRFRALIRESLSRGSGVMPLDYVIIPRPGCAEEPFQNLNQLLRWAFKRYEKMFPELLSKEERSL